MNRIANFYESNHLLVLIVLVIIFGISLISIKYKNRVTLKFKRNIVKNDDSNNDYKKIIIENNNLIDKKAKKSIDNMYLDNTQSMKNTQKDIPTEKNNVFSSVISNIESHKKIKENLKIGQYVKKTFREAFIQGLISNDEIQNLQNPKYSKTNFNANYEVLRLKTRKIKDANGINRYYSPEIFCNNYYLTSQWIEPQRYLYMKWLKKIGYTSN